MENYLNYPMETSVDIGTEDKTMKRTANLT